MTGGIKDSIKRAAVELACREDFSNVRIVSLCEAAHVSRTSFYRYYETVDAVYAELENEFFEGMREINSHYVSQEIDEKTLDEPLPIVCDLARYLLEHKDYFLAMTGRYENYRFMNKWYRQAREFYGGKLAYEEVDDVARSVMVEFAAAGQIAVLRYWMIEHPEITLEEIAPISQAVLFAPMLTLASKQSDGERQLNWRGRTYIPSR